MFVHHYVSFEVVGELIFCFCFSGQDIITERNVLQGKKDGETLLNDWLDGRRRKVFADEITK